MTELVHISQTRCSKCNGLRKNIHTQGYQCPRNRVLPEMLVPDFGQHCELFEEKRGVYNGKNV